MKWGQKNEVFTIKNIEVKSYFYCAKREKFDIWKWYILVYFEGFIKIGVWIGGLWLAGHRISSRMPIRRGRILNLYTAGYPMGRILNLIFSRTPNTIKMYCWVLGLNKNLYTPDWVKDNRFKWKKSLCINFELFRYFYWDALSCTRPTLLYPCLILHIIPTEQTVQSVQVPAFNF